MLSRLPIVNYRNSNGITDLGLLENLGVVSDILKNIFSHENTNSEKQH